MGSMGTHGDRKGEDGKFAIAYRVEMGRLCPLLGWIIGRWKYVRDGKMFREGGDRNMWRGKMFRGEIFRGEIG